MERQLQEMMVVGENLQMEARALDEQRQVLESVVRDLRRGRDTLEALKTVKPGEETLLPVGGGTYVRASLGDNATVLASVGSGVILEDSLANAHARLDERLKGTEQALQRTMEEARKIEQDLSRLNAVLSRYGG